jgi:5-oxoprolinase (ATP-hydrolysing)
VAALEVELARAVEAELTEQGVDLAATSKVIRLHLRYAGTDTTLPVTWDGSPDAARAEFEAAHKAQFGFVSPDKPVTVEAVEVEMREAARENGAQTNAKAASRDAAFDRSVPIFSRGHTVEAAVFPREALSPGDRVRGPALIIEPNQTVVVEPGWTAELTVRDDILMRRHEKMARTSAAGTTQADPILLEVFNNLFMNIAEQMGVALQNTAHSVNIKERLDFSCAVFDREGALVANAPHMPVHLGSMDRSVETVIRLNEGKIRPGDVFALNAPYNGGTHLPDITVVSPVFDDEGREILSSGSPPAGTTPMWAAPRPAP